MLREHRFAAWGALAWFVVLEALLVGAILFWPSFEDNIDALRDMAPMESLKGMIDQLEAGGIVAYVNGQHFFKGCHSRSSSRVRCRAAASSPSAGSKAPRPCASRSCSRR